MSERMSSAEFLAMQGSPAPKNPRSVMAGKRAQSGGKRFEQDLAMAHLAYESIGVARIEDLPVPTQPMPTSWLKDPKVHAGHSRILAKRQGFDYYGTFGDAMHDGTLMGRAVAMEAKQTAMFKNRLPIRDTGGIRPHQLGACAVSWSRFATLSAVVWRNGEMRGVLLPDRIVDLEQQYRIGSLKSLPWSAFVPYSVEMIDPGGPIEHWIKPLADWAIE